MTGNSFSATSADNRPSHVVGIGASAGGLEALQEFVRHLPTRSGIAFIVVQHLSPDFKSVMDELLQVHTELSVSHAADGLTIEADHIYLIPPRKNLQISGNHIELLDQTQHNGINFPIDIFFRSLAEAQQHRSIAIVLSGTGSDGSRGVVAVKDAGGLVMVQDPEDARFDGMPRNAIDTGVADVITHVERMPGKLFQYVSNPIVAEDGNNNRDLEGSERALHDIYSKLHNQTSIDFSQYKSSTVSRRIERRIGIHGLGNIIEYNRYLQSHEAEIKVLGRDMLVGVTQFFRDPEAFNHLRSKVIPKIVRDSRTDDPIRVWIAGCSTGEEAYSVAMLFDEELKRSGEERSVKLFATDVNPQAIATASTGFYPLNIAEDLSPQRLEKYFIRTEKGFTVNPELREKVLFAAHNLLLDPPFSFCQLVICRNLLIYMQPKAQKRILTMLHFALQMSGYLFLGSSESLGDLGRYFSIIDDRSRLYQKQESDRIMTRSLSDTTYAGKAERPTSPPTAEHLMRSYHRQQKSPLHMSVLETLITRFAPPCLIISHDMEVLHVYGDVAPYTRKLGAGKFSSRVTDHLANELAIPVSTAVHRALEEKKSIQYGDIRYKINDQDSIAVNLHVLYVDSGSPVTGYLAVLFEHESLNKEESSEITPFDAHDETQRTIRKLEEALQHNREHLDATVQELETTNEELQSSNEELMSANEELQSTNEELQSVNEELYTVNSEYQDKIEELNQANLDIENIIKSADIGFIFLDDALLIRRFSPMATRDVNLLESDIGRPFHHISHNLDYAGLLDDIVKVLETSAVIEKEVAGKDDYPVLVRISPYYNEHNIALGCVLTLTDVSDIHLLRNRLDESYQQLRGTLETSFWREPKSLSILLVEDDEADRLAVAHALRTVKNPHAHYHVTESTSYDDAVKKLQTSSPDVCLLDYKLMEHTGLELVEKLAGSKPSPAFIVLSGVVDDFLLENAVRLGIYDVIDKQDVTPALLERSIRYTQRHRLTEIYLTRNNS